jgi:tetratricopeptide (TPR) repeat protein
MKRLLLVIFAIFTLLRLGYSQSVNTGLSKNDKLITKFMQFSPQQLFDTANYYFFNNSVDTALICYGLIINTPVKNANLKLQELMIDAYIRTAHIYANMGNYLNAYKLLIDALLSCEKYQVETKFPLIYNNLGNIYANFQKLDIAKSYYFKALHLHKDTTSLDLVFNNIGCIEMFSDNLDSAFYFLDKSLQICKRYNRTGLSGALNGMGYFYQKAKQYDSAFYYYRLSLEEVKKNTIIERRVTETDILSNLGNLFFETGKTDSALFYIHLSNYIAQESNYLKVLADNYLILSKIEESRGNTKNAYEKLKKYISLKDSISSTEVLGNINQLQRYYEVSKTNEQIERLIFEQQMKERTIFYQKMIWIITLALLFLVSTGLLFIYLQHKRLNKAYKVLFEKNIEIIELLDHSSGKQTEKYKNTSLNDAKQNELVEKILRIMEDSSIICDTDFSLTKLAVLLQNNHVYVSQVINNVFKKNFRLLLNGYRIKEAQKLFSESDVEKYTLEYIAKKVGYNSSDTFRNAFKEITGVRQSFYLNSIMEKKSK